MGFLLRVAFCLVLLGTVCHTAKIKYIVRSGPYQNDPNFLENSWPRESHSIAGSSDNSISSTTEPNFQECELNGSCSDAQEDSYDNVEATFKPFPREHLEKILQKFNNGDNKLANIYIDRSDTPDESPHRDTKQDSPDQHQQQQQSDQQQTQSIDKSKSWNQFNQQQSHNKHPYEDRQGWVTLEPIAWSSSQIQKWEPNPRPTFPPPNEAANYWNAGTSSSQPQYGGGGSSDRPWNKPSYEYNTKPQWGNKYPSNQNYEYKPTYSSGGSWGGGNPDIITDNRPGSFPSDNRPSGSHDSGGYKPWGSTSDYHHGGQPSASYNKPTYSYGNSVNNYGSSSERPSVYPSTADGDGHWVLLSSTKGYSIPQRHRSNSRSMNLSDASKDFTKTITANVVNS